MRALLSSQFLGRLALAMLITFAVYNISGMSYYHWVTSTPFEGYDTAAGFGKLLVGLVFLVAFAFFFWSTWRAPAKLIYLGIVAIVVCIVIFLNLLGWVNLRDPNIGTVIAQVLIAFTFALGSMWSIIWFGRTGHRSVDDPDTGDEVHNH